MNLERCKNCRWYKWELFGSRCKNVKYIIVKDDGSFTYAKCSSVLIFNTNCLDFEEKIKENL
jgi:hypothetical protein